MIVQAVLQSPGFIPVRGNILGRETIFKSFMAAANCSDLECLRHIPTDIIIKANAVISSSDTNINTTIGPGPVVDGDYVPDLPSKLLLEGQFHKNAIVVTANNAHEVRLLCYLPLPRTSINKTIRAFFSILLRTM